jgi:predicted nucleic acid-binding protein
VSFVLDSSVALSWCFEDERSAAGEALLYRVAEAGAVAPLLWPLEILNGLMTAERRRRLDAARRRRLAGFLNDLPVTLDADTASRAWNDTLRLAEQHRLTMYDAVYLELALRLDLPLASLDRDLRRAGHAAGVALLGG